MHQSSIKQLREIKKIIPLNKELRAKKHTYQHSNLISVGTHFYYISVPIFLVKLLVKKTFSSRQQLFFKPEKCKNPRE